MSEENQANTIVGEEIFLSLDNGEFPVRLSSKDVKRTLNIVYPVTIYGFS